MADKEKDASSSEIVRRFKQNPALFIGTVIVLVLVTVSFVLVPAIVPNNRGNADLTFGYYNKAPISWVPGNFFAQYQDMLIRNNRNRVDINDFQIQLTIWRQAFEVAAVHTAILQEMKKSNYSIPARIVDREVARLPQFQHNGRFSSALYNQMSDTERLILWRQVQDELIKIQYYNDLFSIVTPSGETEFMANMTSVMRNFQAVSFPVDNYPDSEYRAFAAENAGMFNSIHLSRIVISSSEREAAKILNSIKDGTSSFEDTAKNQSHDSLADRGGDMGIKYVFELEQEIPNAADREKILGLGRGEYSNVIKFNDMWAFFRVEEEVKHPDFEDTAVMDRVKYYVRSYRRGLMENWAIAQANEFRANAETSGFSYAAVTAGEEAHEFGPLPLNFGSVDLFAGIEYYNIPELSSQDMTNLSQNEKFWKAAFLSEINVPSEPIVQGNRVLVILPAEQIETDEEQLEMIRSGYSDWISNLTEGMLGPYFIKSPKMEDNFWDVYYRFFMPSFNN
ncbi:MAG: peptidylprolyl isomerase [Treponema sp.]|jgi:hypothetical protein|nr:peptidylprolyl isomerase [Treponema sp.]